MERKNAKQTENSQEQEEDQQPTNKKNGKGKELEVEVELEVEEQEDQATRHFAANANKPQKVGGEDLEVDFEGSGDEIQRTTRTRFLCNLVFNKFWS